MSINNNMYNELADAWWNENGILHLLKVMVNPWRVPYFSDRLKTKYGPSLDHIRVLDIGCGGGILTEEFARLNCQVTGIDISAESIQVAREHAQAGALSIDYRLGSATQLEFDDNCFDVVSCCDVLEHLNNWQQVIAEASRVLNGGGLFFFDTINRTPKSKINFIFGLQEWSFTKLFPRDTHVWDLFITPEEIGAAFKKHDIKLQGLSGSVISGNPLSILKEVRRYKRGEITVAELGSKLELKHDPDLSLNYLGFGEKQ